MASQSVTATSTEHSELLCFVADKSKLMALDHIVKIVTDFYSEEDLLSARSILDNYVDRLPKRRGSDMLKSTAEDIVKAVLSPSFNLPAFYATDLSRLPPVDASHCDVSVILMEIRALRNEVKNVSQLKGEIELLKSEVEVLKLSLAELQSVPTVSSPASDGNVNEAVSNGNQLFSGLAKELAAAGTVFKLEKSQRKPSSHKPVVGTNSVNNMSQLLQRRNVLTSLSPVFILLHHAMSCLTVSSQ